MIRILVVDDHAVVRRGLRDILVDIEESVVVDEASRGQEALAKIEGNDYDI